MDFALIMFVLLLLTGGIWLLDRFALAAKRGSGVAEPWWVEYAKSFFPGHTGGIFHTFLFDRAVQDSVRLDDSDPACR